jgi:SAM-dependent methyltransferase
LEIDWDKYTNDNVENYYKDVSKLIWYNCVALGCSRILDVGCNIGMELVDFDRTANVTGVDINKTAVLLARQRFPDFTFMQGDIMNIDFPDNSYDMVFDRGVMIHQSRAGTSRAMSEMLRISRRYVLNIEYYGEDGKEIEWRKNEPLFYRDMKKRWESFNVDIISDVEIPLEIDDNKVHYTLVRKLEPV